MKSSGPTVIRSMTARTPAAFGEEVAVAVERAGEVEPEHPVRRSGQSASGATSAAKSASALPMMNM